MCRYQLRQSSILRTRAQTAHDLLYQGHGYLRVVIKMNGTILSKSVRGRLSDIMQQRGHFHTWSCERRERKNALLFRLI